MLKSQGFFFHFFLARISISSYTTSRPRTDARTDGRTDGEESPRDPIHHRSPPRPGMQENPIPWGDLFGPPTPIIISKSVHLSLARPSSKIFYNNFYEKYFKTCSEAWFWFGWSTLRAWETQGKPTFSAFPSLSKPNPVQRKRDFLWFYNVFAAFWGNRSDLEVLGKSEVPATF